MSHCPQDTLKPWQGQGARAPELYFIMASAARLDEGDLARLEGDCGMRKAVRALWVAEGWVRTSHRLWARLTTSQPSHLLWKSRFVQNWSSLSQGKDRGTTWHILHLSVSETLGCSRVGCTPNISENEPRPRELNGPLHAYIQGKGI